MPDTDNGHTWIVGIDGSKHAEHALAWAAHQAPGRTERLELVTAWQVPMVAGGAEVWAMGTPAYDRDALIANAQQHVDAAAATIDDCSVDMVTTVTHGGASAVLLDAADEADLLVVGTRGLGGFKRLLLGSTSTQCATHCTRPVAVIPDSTTVSDTNDIVVAIDGSANSIAALEWALSFADDDAQIEALSVWDTSPLAAGADQFFFPEATGLAEERFHHLIDDVEANAERSRQITRSFLTGTPRRTISERAATADLLVVGARGHGAIGAAVIGSVSMWLLHNVAQPVVVVPDPPE